MAGMVCAHKALTVFHNKLMTHPTSLPSPTFLSATTVSTSIPPLPPPLPSLLHIATMSFLSHPLRSHYHLSATTPNFHHHHLAHPFSPHSLHHLHLIPPPPPQPPPLNFHHQLPPLFPHTAITTTFLPLPLPSYYHLLLPTFSFPTTTIPTY